MTRDKVVEIAKSWLRTPYHHRAKLKGHGVDCGQILIAVFSEAGLISDFDTGEYPQDWMLHRDEERYLKSVEKYAHRVEVPKPGDIALFKFGRCVSHAAIVVEWPIVIHSYKIAGMVTYDDVTANKNLENRLVGFWSVFEE